MKDYTKYDFNVIVGAEVEITQYGGHKYSGTLKLVGRQNGAILLYPSDEKKPAYWFVIENIVPGSLSAKIKVEDMSLKQLKQYAEILKERNGEKARVVFTVHQEQRDEYVYFACTLHDCPSKFITDEYRHFTDYIDCTDWGWRE